MKRALGMVARLHMNHAKPGERGTPSRDTNPNEYPKDLCWPGALDEALACSDIETYRPTIIRIRKDRFARREPGF